MEQTDKTKLSIAKIGAVQAIIVALITAFAGVSAGYFARGDSAPSQEVVQRWISVDGIQTIDYPLIRLVITVNGANYSYPSKAIWAQVGENRERFPLPMTSENYRVSFQAFLSEDGNQTALHAASQHVDEIAIDHLPANQKLYNLYEFGGSSSVYGTRSNVAQIKFSVE